MNEMIIGSILFFILGTIIGSFLNVCIARMPLEQSVVRPRSHCFKCKAPIAWYDNVPLLSYLVLRGKCRKCGESYSIRYWFVELFTGLVFAGMYYYYGLSPLLWPYLFMVSCFIVATLIDFGHRIIPDEISVGGMCAGLVFSLLIPQMHGIDPAAASNLMPYIKSLGISLLGVLIGGGTIYGMAILGDWMFKKESMGGGDIKLLAMIGAFLGWESALLTFFIAPFFGAVYGTIERIRTKDSTMAYGPFLIVAAMICLFWEQELIAWIMSGYGLY